MHSDQGVNLPSLVVDTFSRQEGWLNANPSLKRLQDISTHSNVVDIPLNGFAKICSSFNSLYFHIFLLGSRFPEINQAVENLVKSSHNMPDYPDVRKLVEDVYSTLSCSSA